LKLPALSFSARLAIVFSLALLVVAGVTTLLAGLPLPRWQIFLAAILLGLPAGLLLLSRELRPVGELLRALRDGISCLEDGDFSFRLAKTRSDELGQLIEGYNRAVAVLREERKALREQELLLETALARSPVATLLITAGRVIYANLEAAQLLLGGGGRLEGRPFAEIVGGCPPEMAEALADGGDGLFAVDRDGDVETYHISQRFFTLDQRRHQLVLLRRLTSELDRQEARMWKKVIRVISHELNNSLAPVSSLVHSAGVALEKPERHERLPRIFAAIEERLVHLRAFLEGYARFARLPQPVKEKVDWRAFLGRIRELYPYRLEGETGAAQGFFDPVLIEQVLINLLKNATEAAPGKQIVVRLQAAPQGGTLLQVLDRGPGMDGDLLRGAMLPFFTTKKMGTGVGLPLCREILAEHGGRLSIRNREGGGLAVTCFLPD
jgi:two-component system nitrogen regulation sensor histidine kinase NtrY